MEKKAATPVRRSKRNVVVVIAEDGSHQDGISTRKAKKRAVEINSCLTNKEVEEKYAEEKLSSKEEEESLKEIEDLMKSNNLALTPSPATKGDGNCWFRAVSEQVERFNIPDKARNYKSLRQEVRSPLSSLL